MMRHARWNPTFEHRLKLVLDRFVQIQHERAAAERERKKTEDSLARLERVRDDAAVRAYYATAAGGGA